MKKIKHIISKIIASILPNRVVYWTLIRAYAYTTVHSYPDKTPDEIGFSLLLKSWEFKHKHSLNDRKTNWKPYSQKEYEI